MLENLTALVLLAASGVLVSRFIRQRANNTVRQNVFLLGLALVFFFGFGEEISWGQRLLNIDAPRFFNEHNLQREVNFHNLEFFGLKVNIILFSYGLVSMCALYFASFLFLYKRNLRFQKLIDQFGVPVPKLYHSVSIAVATGIILLIPHERKWEIWECSFVLLMLLVLLDAYNSKSVSR
jgi:hypothetical protein